MNEQWIKDYLAKYPCKVLPSGNVRTCPVRLSFPHLFEPKAFEDGKPQYSASLLFPRGANLSVLLTRGIEAADGMFGSKWKAELPSGKILGKGSKLIHFPFRDGKEREDKGGYEAGAYFFNTASEHKPGVVDSRAQPIRDESQIYAGIWALVTVRPFAYDAKKRAGVSFGLQNVQKLADDEPLGSVRPSPEDEFEPLDDTSGDDDWSTKGDSLDNLAGL